MRMKGLEEGVLERKVKGGGARLGEIGGNYRQPGKQWLEILKIKASAEFQLRKIAD